MRGRSNSMTQAKHNQQITTAESSQVGCLKWPEGMDRGHRGVLQPWLVVHSPTGGEAGPQGPQAA